MKKFKIFRILLLFGVLWMGTGCDSTAFNNSQVDNTGPENSTPENPPSTPGFPLVAFNPMGSLLAFNLIDLEFLPGQNGDLLVAGKDGTLYYLDSSFNLVATADINDHGDANQNVKDGFERGLQNIIAHPNYDSNGMIYIYYSYNTNTATDLPENDVNRVERRTVSVNKIAGTMTLNDPQIIIEFPKSESCDPGHNHNGGGMTFDPWGNLVIGVGDGGGNCSADTDVALAQDNDLGLGKIHRVVPNATASQDGYTLPTQPVEDLNQQPGHPTWPSLYVSGVRNPFSLVNKDKGDQFFGDPGTNVFEEINCLYDTTENYGWPFFEGKESLPGFEPAAHGYAHDDNSFADEDPLAVVTGSRAIIVLGFLEGDQAYGADFDRRLIYTDFYQGWVRALRVEVNHLKTADDHIGHQEGMTSLQKNPADNFFYGVSLGGSQQVLKMELAP